jgi:hypothetical protein
MPVSVLRHVIGLDLTEEDPGLYIGWDLESVNDLVVALNNLPPLVQPQFIAYPVTTNRLVTDLLQAIAAGKATFGNGFIGKLSTPELAACMVNVADIDQHEGIAQALGALPAGQVVGRMGIVKGSGSTIAVEAIDLPLSGPLHPARRLFGP